MNKRLFNILAWLMPLLLLSCDKLPDNGDLDGMWQLMLVENRTSGERINMAGTQHYWSFRLRLVQFTTHKELDSSSLYAHFTNDGNTLHLNDFCTAAKYETDTDDNEWVSPAQANLLSPWGIHPQPDPKAPSKTVATFHVEQLSSSTLVLSDNNNTLFFRKF